MFTEWNCDIVCGLNQKVSASQEREVVYAEVEAEKFDG